jgi:hypothetical protein
MLDFHDVAGTDDELLFGEFIPRDQQSGEIGEGVWYGLIWNEGPGGLILAVDEYGNRSVGRVPSDAGMHDTWRELTGQPVSR